MGQLVSKNGVFINNPSWQGWIKKAGVFNKAWKNRYFCLEENGQKLVYFKDPNKKSKGWIDLKECTGMCLLAHRPDFQPSHVNHLPFLICTKKRIWMLAFSDEFLRDSFLRAIKEIQQHPPQLQQVIAEDFVMIQEDPLHDRKKNRWEKLYLVYLSNGELVFFADGSTKLLVRHLNVKDVLQFDIETSNEFRNPASYNANTMKDESVSKTIQLLCDESSKSVLLEFNTKKQYQKWRFILYHAIEENDLCAESFAHCLEKDAARVKLERKRKVNVMSSRRKQRHQKKHSIHQNAIKRRNHTMLESDIPVNVDDIKNLTRTRSSSDTSKDEYIGDVDFLAKNKSEKVKKVEKGMGDRDGRNRNQKESLDESTMSLNNKSETEKVKERVGKQGRKRNSRSRKKNSGLDHVKKHNKTTRNSTPNFATEEIFPPLPPPLPTDDLASPSRVSNAESLDQSKRDENPVLSRQKSFSMGNNRHSSSLKEQILSAGFGELYEDLDNDFQLLLKTIDQRNQNRSEKKRRKQEKKLKKQVEACAQAIENLRSLVPSPKVSSKKKNSSNSSTGDWYTLEPCGGKRVRHWIYRGRTKKSKN